MFDVRRYERPQLVSRAGNRFRQTRIPSQGIATSILALDWTMIEPSVKYIIAQKLLLVGRYSVCRDLVNCHVGSQFVICNTTFWLWRIFGPADFRRSSTDDLKKRMEVEKNAERFREHDMKYNGATPGIKVDHEVVVSSVNGLRKSRL